MTARPARCLALALAITACESSYPVPIKVILPEDDDSLDRADNAALVLLPEGEIYSYEIDGTDFELALELEPDDVNRAIELYLADGDQLLVWGTSAPFSTQNPTEDLAIFLGQPGALSIYPGELVEPDPAVLAASAEDRGIVLLGAAGETFLFNQYTLDADEGARFEPEGGAPAADDGALLGDGVGGVLRVVWAESLAAWRFDPGLNEWSEIALTSTVEATPRPGAAHLVDAAGTGVLIFGGGATRDVIELSFVAESDDARAVTVIDGLTLDDPRPGAHASWLTREDTDDDEAVLLAGTRSPDVPALLIIPVADAPPTAVGPAEPWEALRCQQVDVGEAAKAGATIRALCAGGVRAGAPTADGLLVRLTPGEAPEVEELPALLGEAMAAPLWFSDDSAIYAQYDGRWLSIPRDTLELVETPSPALRARGGCSVKLGTGATFLLGGETVDEAAVDRWHVFTPAIPPG
ncbi:MAG: hypothetical protein KC636_27830 [Myxococcales bacterium]|nr:hypothetical protein [Myxococcales bacterium]